MKSEPVQDFLSAKKIYWSIFRIVYNICLIQYLFFPLNHESIDCGISMYWHNDLEINTHSKTQEISIDTLITRCLSCFWNKHFWIHFFPQLHIKNSLIYLNRLFYSYKIMWTQINSGHNTLLFVHVVNNGKVLVNLNALLSSQAWFCTGLLMLNNSEEEAVVTYNTFQQPRFKPIAQRLEAI